MSASVVEVASPRVVRAWRDRIVSLVVSGVGTSSDLSPRFPGELPADLPLRFASLRFEEECCTLAVYVDIDDPAALVLRLTSESKLELEVDGSSVRVEWCLPVEEMSWLTDDPLLLERAREARRFQGISQGSRGSARK